MQGEADIDVTHEARVKALPPELRAHAKSYEEIMKILDMICQDIERCNFGPRALPATPEAQHVFTAWKLHQDLCRANMTGLRDAGIADANALERTASEFEVADHEGEKAFTKVIPQIEETNSTYQDMG
jgi:uncharacterized protein YukE